MKIKIDENSCKHLGISELYDLIAVKISGKPYSCYDCTKVLVGEKIFEEVQHYYLEEKNVDKFYFTMYWCCYGPKAMLNDYEVEVEDGWAYDDIKEEE